MPRFMMTYKGDATDMSDMTPEEGAAVMAKWGEWMAKVGPALVDVGAPFGPGHSIVDDGTEGVATGLTGYSLVEAASLPEARKLTSGHPYLSEGKGNFAIDIFELLPVPLES